jgi:hypothetical protein
MLAPLAVDPQPWRNPPKVGEGGNWGGGHPTHRQSMAPFARLGKPRGLVARLRQYRYSLRPCRFGCIATCSLVFAKAVRAGGG